VLRKHRAPGRGSNELSVRKLLILLVAGHANSLFSSQVLDTEGAKAPNISAILNKENRKLPPPPRSIKSDVFNPEERFEVALERSESAVALSGEEENSPSASSSLRVLLGTNKKIRDKSVSLSVMGGGLSGLVGMRADVAIEPIWLSGQIGSGVDYTTWAMGVRKYLLPTLSFLPFIDLKYTEWFLKKSEQGTAAEYPFPTYATEKFFENPYEKQTARLISPGLGMALLGKDGFGMELGAQYLWSFDVNRGALLGSLGLVKYF